MTPDVERRSIGSRILDSLCQLPAQLINIAFLVGTILAVTDSYQKYHSAKYSLFCGFASWAYVWYPEFYDGAFMK